MKYISPFRGAMKIRFAVTLAVLGLCIIKSYEKRGRDVVIISRGVIIAAVRPVHQAANALFCIVIQTSAHH